MVSTTEGLKRVVWGREKISAPPFMEATDASRLVCVIVVSYQEYSLTHSQCSQVCWEVSAHTPTHTLCDSLTHTHAHRPGKVAPSGGDGLPLHTSQVSEVWRLLVRRDPTAALCRKRFRYGAA